MWRGLAEVGGGGVAQSPRPHPLSLSSLPPLPVIPRRCAWEPRSLHMAVWKLLAPRSLLWSRRSHAGKGWMRGAVWVGALSRWGCSYSGEGWELGKRIMPHAPTRCLCLCTGHFPLHHTASGCFRPSVVCQIFTMSSAIPPSLPQGDKVWPKLNP